MGESKRQKKYNPLTDMFNLKLCDICGKDFIVHDTSTWAYKKQDYKHRLYFCSYKCLQEYKRRKGLI